MEAVPPDLALRYLLELSTDIRSALLIVDGDGLVAAAPETPSERCVELGGELVREVRGLSGNAARGPVEVDVTVGGGAAFCVSAGGLSLVCVTGRLALPGLVLHDMRVVLTDVRAAAGTGSRPPRAAGSEESGP